MTRSHRLRRKETVSEMLLWRELRNRKLAGYKFRRQVAIGPFIVDFYCAECVLIIELDGSIHLENTVRVRDKRREKYLLKNGYRILRFTNDEINNNLDEVLRKITEYSQYLLQNPSPLSPLPLREERGTR